MNTGNAKAVCDAYYSLVMSDWRKSGLLLKVLDAMVSGGQKYTDLERLFDDVDEGAVIRAATFKLNCARGGGDDPMAQAIARISK